MAVHTVSFVTGDPAKLASAREHLAGLGVDVVAADLDLDRIQAGEVRTVAAHQARRAHRVLGSPVMTEACGFVIDELGYPGPMARPLLEAADARGVVALADLTRTRRARLVSSLAYVAADGTSRVFTDDRRTGTVPPVPIGEAPAGAWAQLTRAFIPDGQHTTLAAMDAGARSRLLSAWRSESVFAALRRWLAGEAAEHRDGAARDARADDGGTAPARRSPPSADVDGGGGEEPGDGDAAARGGAVPLAWGG